MANTKFQIKRSIVPGKIPQSSDLEIGELAINLTDSKIFSKHSLGNIVTLSDYELANSAIIIAELAYETANSVAYSSNTIIIEAVNNTQNNNINSAFNQANSVYNFVNTNITLIQGVDDTQNTNITLIQGVDDTQNTNISIVTTSAQAAFTHANAAFSSSNTKFSSSGGTISGDVVVTGNVTVQGTTTTLNVDTLVVEDKNITLANVAIPTDVTADGAGLTILGATNKTWNWVDATDSWTSSENVNLLTGKTYKINGVDVLTSTTLGSGVTSSSLTSVGTLTNLTVSGNTSTLTGLFRNGDTSAGFTKEQIRFGYSGADQYQHYIHTRHNAGSTACNAIDFYTSDGTQNGVYPTNAVHGMSIVGGNVGIGTTTPAYKLDVNGTAKANTLTLTANTASTNTTTGTLIVTGGVGISGALNATTKSFDIEHPSDPTKRLRYGSLESPFHGVRLTGKGTVYKGNGIVTLPYYIRDLIQEEGINIQITNIKHGKVIWVEDIILSENKFTVGSEWNEEIEFFWTFTGIRKDVSELVVEY